MNKKNNTNQEIKTLKDSLNKLTLLVQALLMEFIIIFVVLALYIPEFMVSLAALLSITLFVLSYNNYAIYKRKHLTIIYLMFAVIVFLSIFLTKSYG